MSFDDPHAMSSESAGNDESSHRSSREDAPRKSYDSGSRDARSDDNCSLFIGNIPFKMTDDALRELLKEFGEVTRARVVLDRETNRSRGFAFAAMSTPEEAQRAISALNDSPYEGRDLRVNLAESKGPSSGGDRRGGAPRGDRRDGGGGGRDRDSRPPRRDGGGGSRY